VRSAYALDASRPCDSTRNCVWIVTDAARGETLLHLPGES